MPKQITYNWGDDHLLITLGNRTQGRIKILYFAEFLVTSGMATIFVLRALPLTANAIHLTIAIGAAMLYFLASYRFLARMFYSEKLLLDRYGLNIIRRTPFLHHARYYAWNNMGPLHYTGKPKKTDHPLKGKTFDYFGFETHEHLVQSLHHEGNLCFIYDDEMISFARGVYSWDAENMVHMMKLYTGASLRLGPEWDLMLQENEIDDAQ